MERTYQKVLHLILKKKWWDMIASGVKKEEYRRICDYYTQRLTVPVEVNVSEHETKTVRSFKDIDLICFHEGYTNTTMTWQCKGIEIGFGLPEWGGPEDKQVYIIKLGERED